MTKARLKKVDNFLEFQQRLFPDGNIPTREEIKNLVQGGDTSVRTYILNKMYRDGVPTDPFLLLDERAKDFANKFNDAFGKNTLQTSKNMFLKVQIFLFLWIENPTSAPTALFVEICQSPVLSFAVGS